MDNSINTQLQFEKTFELIHEYVSVFNKQLKTDQSLEERVNSYEIKFQKLFEPSFWCNEFGNGESSYSFLINSTFEKERAKLEEIGEYYFGCSLETYENNYQSRKNQFFKNKSQPANSEYEKLLEREFILSELGKKFNLELNGYLNFNQINQATSAVIAVEGFLKKNLEIIEKDISQLGEDRVLNNYFIELSEDVQVIVKPLSGKWDGVSILGEQEFNNFCKNMYLLLNSKEIEKDTSYYTLGCTKGFYQHTVYKVYKCSEQAKKRDKNSELNRWINFLFITMKTDMEYDTLKKKFSQYKNDYKRDLSKRISFKN